VKSKSVLWDSRYWIKIQASHEAILSAVTVRPFRKDDAHTVGDHTRLLTKPPLSTLLHYHAPGSIRWTLPVLAIGGYVVTFPTLWKNALARNPFDQAVSSLGLTRGWLKWEVCYKVITEPLEEWALESNRHTYKSRLYDTTNKPASPSPLFPERSPSYTPYPPRSPADYRAPA